MQDIEIIDAEDLVLYIDNKFDLCKNKFEPITTALTRKRDTGKYDHADAMRAFMPLMQAGARKYQGEFPNARITPEVKREAATDMRDRFEVEYDLGNYKYLVE